MRRSRLRASGFRVTPWRVVLVLAMAFGVALIGRLVYAAEQPPAAPAADTNLALNRQATGSKPCNDNEGPEKAVNGSVSGGNSDKFCSGEADSFLQVDLQTSTAITSVTVRHAEAGGEPAPYNTRDFDIQVSTDGTTFTTVAEVRGNTAAVTTHPVNTTGRYVRLKLVTPTQINDYHARVYELEVYPAASASASTSASASASPAPAPLPFDCFPFPASDPSLPQHPKIVLEPGLPPLPQKAQELAHRYWEIEWPAIWQDFGDPDRLYSTDAGMLQVKITARNTGWGGGSLDMNYDDLVKAADDGGDTGSWTHEFGHMTQNYHGHVDASGLFDEGIVDFIRFVAHGEDERWKIADLSATNSDFWDEQKTWHDGYGKGARFLLWLTMRYDKSVYRYQLVHDLNTALNHGDRDYDGLFVKLTGKNYHQLFADYLNDRVIPPHC